MKNIEVIDLFCGVGGLTHGLIRQGLNVIAGVDNEESCKWAYENNNKSKFLKKDIKTINGNEILKLYSNNAIKVLAGSPPCQPFSILRKRFKNQNEIDPKYELIIDFLKIIIDVNPDIVIMENVPGMESKEIFKNFINKLQQLNYFITYKIVDCSKIGIPQTRKRLVLLASKFEKINFIKSFQNKKTTVKDVIKNLPKIKAGEICKQDKLHQSSKLSELNLKRIKFLKSGRTLKDLPDNLKPQCKINNFGKNFKNSYSRMEWDKPAPTITTNFLWYGTGKYGHPEQDRTISLREGAIFQTFPNDFDFFNPNLKKTQLKIIARQIGNAVPVKLAEIIGESVIKHLKENIKTSTLDRND